MKEYISIGQIINTYGVKGELKVYPLTDNINRFNDLEDIYIELNEELKNFRIEYIKCMNNLVVMKLKGIDDIDSAKKLQNHYINVHRNNAIKLPENTYFVCDIIDADVYTVEGLYLGKVYDVIQTGSNDVYIVKKQNSEILIPALKIIIKDLNIIEKRIIVDLPEGLI